MVAIEVSGLRKSYGSLEAVRGLDFRVDEGEVFALLGPNGAGKTTTLEILEGFRTRTAGEVRVLGEDPARAGRAQRQRVGIVLQGVVSEPYLTVREVLTRNAAYYPKPRPVVEVIEHVGLSEKADARVKTLSGGQLRRLDVGLGIIGDPELLFLDEPTTGFDPTARRSAWELVRQLPGRGDDHRAHHALHGRGAEPGRPRGGHQRRRDRRRGHPRHHRRPGPGGRPHPLPPAARA